MLGDVPALGRQRVIANWTLPPSGRMRHRVAGVNPGRPHTEIAVGIPVLTRLSDVFFPVGYHYCLAIDMACCACLASWCLFHYIDVGENLDIISGSFQCLLPHGVQVLRPSLVCKVSSI